MAFVNEVVSDADIDAYGLPFEKGKGHWWTRDKERDLYLWGGRGGNPLWDEEIQGRFHLFISGTSLRLAISLGGGLEIGMLSLIILFGINFSGLIRRTWVVWSASM